MEGCGAVAAEAIVRVVNVDLCADCWCWWLAREREREREAKEVWGGEAAVRSSAVLARRVLGLWPKIDMLVRRSVEAIFVLVLVEWFADGLEGEE